MLRLNSVYPNMSSRRVPGLLTSEAQPINFQKVERLQDLLKSENYNTLPTQNFPMENQEYFPEYNEVADKFEDYEQTGSSENYGTSLEQATAPRPEYVKYDLVPAADLNLADPHVNRGGVVLVCDGYIGLSITLFSSSIATFGGTFEGKDRDLLDTAAREFNEEVGDNLPKISKTLLYNGKGLSSDYAMLFFNEIDSIPDEFDTTDETYDIIWVTPEQLDIFARKQEYTIRTNVKTETQGETARVFVFSYDLRAYARDIAYYVGAGADFSQNDNLIMPPSNRPQKQRTTNRVSYPGMIYGIDEFERDMDDLHYWKGSFLVVSKQAIAVYHDEFKIMYKIDKKDFQRFKKSVQSHDYFFYVSYIRQVSEVLGNMGRKIKSILSEKQEIEICEINTNILKTTSRMRFENRMEKEIFALRDIEKAIYECKKRLGHAFNQKRANFLTAISYANSLVRNGYTGEQIVSDLKLKYKDTDPNADSIIFHIRALGLLNL